MKTVKECLVCLAFITGVYAAGFAVQQSLVSAAPRPAYKQSVTLTFYANSDSEIADRLRTYANYIDLGIWPKPLPSWVTVGSAPGNGGVVIQCCSGGGG